jgi:aerobic-type carbon monoxide dehydrogenase small subunit (CoxS/CutS family)
VELQYQSMTCCLMPIGNAHGHIVTIEGINHGKMNPIQVPWPIQPPHKGDSVRPL